MCVTLIYLCRRTGRQMNVNARRDSEGFENFSDYWSDHSAGMYVIGIRLLRESGRAQIQVNANSQNPDQSEFVQNCLHCVNKLK